MAEFHLSYIHLQRQLFTPPTLGVLGAGAMGQAFTRHALRAGYQVTICNKRGPASLKDLVSRLGPGVKAGEVAEAAAADIVLLAIPWSQVVPVLKGLPPWDNRIVIDATNPIEPPGLRMANLAGRCSSEIVAELIPGGRLVKAFNTLKPEWLESDPREAGGRRVIFISGDDADARETVAHLVEKFGFASVVLGTLKYGGRLQQFPDGPLPALNLIKKSWDEPAWAFERRITSLSDR